MRKSNGFNNKLTRNLEKSMPMEKFMKTLFDANLLNDFKSKEIDTMDDEERTATDANEEKPKKEMKPSRRLQSNKIVNSDETTDAIKRISTPGAFLLFPFEISQLTEVLALLKSTAMKSAKAANEDVNSDNSSSMRRFSIENSKNDELVDRIKNIMAAHNDQDHKDVALNDSIEKYDENESNDVKAKIKCNSVKVYQNRVIQKGIGKNNLQVV